MGVVCLSQNVVALIQTGEKQLSTTKAVRSRRLSLAASSAAGEWIFARV